MELNDKTLEELATGLKMPKEDLTKAIESDSLDLSDKVIFSKEDYTTLEKNIRDEEYHKGKTAENEMTLKNQKKKVKESLGLETEGIKSFDELTKLIAKSKDDHYKGLLDDVKSKDTEKFISQIDELQKDKDTLQLKMNESQQTFEQQLSEMKTANQGSIINNELMKITASIPFEVPKSVLSQGKEAEMNYLNAQKTNFITLFKASYEADIIENKLVIKKDGEIIKNNIQNAENADTIALNFAKSNYFNLKTNAVINRDGSQKYGSLLHGMSLEDFNSKMKEEGHHPNSAQYAIYYKEFMDKN